jgi:hypothetical protein
MFQSENALYSVTAHNKHRTNSQKQYGGTFAMAFGELATKVTDSAWISPAWADGPGYSSPAKKDTRQESSQSTNHVTPAE